MSCEIIRNDSVAAVSRAVIDKYDLFLDALNQIDSVDFVEYRCEGLFLIVYGDND